VIERVLSLDISTKTGWSFVLSDPDGCVVSKYGQTEPIPEPEGEYPERVWDWAHKCFSVIKKLIEEHNPDVIVIEQTSKGSKASKTQKLLEWVHYLVADFLIKRVMKNVYLQTGEWRSLVGSKMTKDEKTRNKYVKEYKAKELAKYQEQFKKDHPDEKVPNAIYIIGKNGKRKKKAIVVYDEQGERIGKVGKKNVSVRTANEIFSSQLKKPLQRKDEDTAEALLLAYAYHTRKGQINGQNN
jgi:Holliday junction resolvasome RuvABC endonuclease subunit